MPEKRTIYHIKDGPAEMDAIDATYALRAHSDEWSPDCWPEPQVEKAPAAAEDVVRFELLKETNAELIKLAKAENIPVETGDNKAALVDKIIAGRAANG